MYVKKICILDLGVKLSWGVLSPETTNNGLGFCRSLDRLWCSVWDNSVLSEFLLFIGRAQGLSN